MKDSNLFRVIPGSINHIPIITKTTSTQEKRAVVNAIGKYIFLYNLIDFI